MQWFIVEFKSLLPKDPGTSMKGFIYLYFGASVSTVWGRRGFGRREPVGNRRYVHLSDYVAFYEDFIGMHPEFWNPDLFRLILKRLPSIIRVPENLEVDAAWASKASSHRHSPKREARCRSGR